MFHCVLVLLVLVRCNKRVGELSPLLLLLLLLLSPSRAFAASGPLPLLLLVLRVLQVAARAFVVQFVAPLASSLCERVCFVL